MSELKRIDDFPVVGVIGGGQLARMMQQSAIALGVQLRVLAASPDESAAQVIQDVRIGRHDDPDAVREFARGCDVVTFDHEHVPQAILESLIADGIAVRPGPSALINAQDKVVMRQTLQDAGLPIPQWQVVAADASDDEVAQILTAFGDRAGWPLVLKTSRGGYDGRGVWVVDDRDQALAVIADTELADGAVWLLEQYVPFTRELAAQVARSPHGQAVAYPVVQTVQTDGICSMVISPAPELDDDTAMQAQRVAMKVAQVLDVTGMLAVELFDTGDGVLINELAMRPHNSGHWSMDGAVTSQFENHLRAILDLPLGSPSATSPATVMVNILGTQATGMYASFRHVMARDPRVKVHLYGKAPRPGRKLGHVNAVGQWSPELVERAVHAADFISGAINE